MRVVLYSRSGILDREEVRRSYRHPDREASAAVIRIANRCCLDVGDVIIVEEGSCELDTIGNAGAL